MKKTDRCGDQGKYQQGDEADDDVGVEPWVNLQLRPPRPEPDQTPDEARGTRGTEHPETEPSEGGCQGWPECLSELAELRGGGGRRLGVEGGHRDSSAQVHLRG